MMERTFGSIEVIAHRDAVGWLPNRQPIDPRLELAQGDSDRAAVPGGAVRLGVRPVRS